MARRSIAASVLFALVLVIGAVLAGPAWAHHKAGHDRGGGAQASGDHDGDADSDPGTHYTEDNDTNDGGTPNNQPDDGDNAHPSGKDKSVENGKSGNQGKSESDPDDDGRGPDRSNGGPDKPNGSGGVDLADQDGNNGCGNDDDFEDDNEGWCGKPKDEVDSPTPDEEKPDEENPQPDDEVEGSDETKIDVELAVDAVALGEKVLGAVEDRIPGPLTDVEGEAILARGASEKPDAGAGGILPFTGQTFEELLIGAFALIAGGLLILRARRS